MYSLPVSLMLRSMAFVLVGVVLGGCRTTPAPEIMQPAVVLPFLPAVPTSPIYWDEGRYPNLFSSGSFAVWVDEGVSDLKKLDAVNTGDTLDETALLDAAAVHRRFHVIELHLESRFADASTAYDAVGLRNMDVYLQTPGGNKIRPVQRIMGSSASEKQVEALREFARSNILLFPKIDTLRDKPYLTSEYPGVRLHLSAFNSVYYFEWSSYHAPMDTAAPKPDRLTTLKHELTQNETYQVLSMRFNELYDRLRKSIGGGSSP